MKRTSTHKNPLTFRVPAILEFVPWGAEHRSKGTVDPAERTDRRTFARTKVRGKATVSCPSGPMLIRVTDMHECGAGIRASKPLAPGSVVFVHFHEYKLMGFAHVRHCTNHGLWSYAIGLEFRSSLITEELGRWHIQHIAA